MCDREREAERGQERGEKRRERGRKGGRGRYPGSLKWHLAYPLPPSVSFFYKFVGFPLWCRGFEYRGSEHHVHAPNPVGVGQGWLEGGDRH